eukprot:TCALIF_11101-PA protein Name:"Protein of unknown function" AED:0.09 eAED:0.09 QI:0/0.77/0.73/0.95/0.48/0.58/46/1495/2737
MKLGNDLSEITLHMIEKASQTISSTEVNLGDSFTFEAVLDLPRISIENKSDLNIEIFSLDPEEGVAGFHICQAHVLFKGPQLKYIQDYPVYNDHSKAHYPTYIEKTKITFEQLHTNDEGSPDDENQVKVQFQAVLVDHEQTQNGRQYYLTTGVDFAGQSFVWIGQAKVQTSIVPLEYDAKVDFHNPSSAIRKGNAELFSISAFITEPSADIEFGVFQPLGFNDIFHIGQISYSVGNAFACSRPEFWEERYIRSPSKLTVNNATLRYPFLINREAKRDVNNDVNRIQFQVPVHVLNIDSLTNGITRYLSFGLKIGNKKLWSALHEITIQKADPVVNQEVPVLKKVSMINNLTSSGKVLAGNSVIFRIEMIANPGWSRFDITLSTNPGSPLEPVGARVIRTGTVAYFPPEWTVTRRTDNAISHNFGLVKNVDDTNPTTVVLEAAFAIQSIADDSSGEEAIISVGGETLSDPTLFIDIESNPNPNDVTVAIEEYGFDNKLYLAGQAAFDMIVHIPSGSGSESLHFEAVPDFDVTDFSLRLCRASIINIGKALPCVRHSDTLLKDVYSKSDDTKPFNDFGNIDVGRTCPLNYPSTYMNDNSFTASLVYELPRGQSVDPGSNVRISGGVRLGNNTIWVSSMLYEAQNTPMGPNIITSLNFNETVGNTTEPVPFVTSYPIITTRGRNSPLFNVNEGFYIQYIMKFQPGTKADYKFVIEPPGPQIKICKLIITHIGQNFPCAQPPGSTVTGYENIELQHDKTGDVCGESATFTFWGLTNWGRDPIIHDLTPDDDSIQIKAYFQVCMQGASAVPEVLNVLHRLDPESIQGESEIELSGIIKDFTHDRGIEGTTYKSLTGPDDIFYSRAPKLMRFEIRVPENYLGDIILMINNTHYDEDHVLLEVCDIAVVKVGENLPCLDVTKDVIKEYGTESKMIGSETVHRTLLVRMQGVCYVQVDSIDDASLITVEAVVRVRDVSDGRSVGITAHVIPVGGFSESLSDQIDVTMVVTSEMPQNFSVDTLLPEEPTVSPLDDSEIYTETSQKVWIPFLIVLPLEKTVQIEATFLTPSTDGVAVYHITDVRFGDIEGGRNIPCTSAKVHLQSAYGTIFQQTSNVTTLMQRDIVTIDLGYVMNTGFTKKQKNHNASRDDRFAIEVEVQMSDHVLATNGSSWNVALAVKFGEIVVVANKMVNVLRSDAIEHDKGNLNAVLALVNEDDTHRINLVTCARVNRMALTSHSQFSNSKFRKVTKVAVLVSNVPGNFIKVLEKDMSISNIIHFIEPLETRFLRIGIREDSSVNNLDILPLAINGVSFFGCLPSETKPELSECVSKRETIDSSDTDQYRHFAVDNLRDQLFFCDTNPRINGTACFSVMSIDSDIQFTRTVNDLGQDWVISQDLNDMDHWRTKRAAGYMIDDVVVNMTEIARQTLGEEEMNIGDSITFNMEIDFPGLAISEKTDLVIEIFGLKPDTGIAGFHICQAHMIDPRGSNIKAIQEYPHYTETNMHEFPNLVEKTRLQFQQVHTNNISDLVNNKIGVQFQAVMVPSPGMVNGEDYYITAGAEYGEDTYIYEAKVELKNPPTIISKGSSALFVIEAFITDPAVSIDFGTFQPLGYSDLFHIGQITFETGNAFACSDPKFWKDKYLPSPTELSVVNASLSYPMLINREADRLVTEEKNKMVFYVPIHVLNVDTVSASKVRNVAFGLKIATAGKNDLYLEAVPDFDQTEVSAWICQLRILEVGFGLPCLRHRIRDNLTNFNRSHTDRPFYDFASLYLGQTCPMRSIETPDDNDFLVQIVYELPPQESITTGYRRINDLGVNQRNETSPIESAYSTTTTPFVTSYPIVSTQDRSSPILKGNEVFFIQYLIKTQKGTRGHYVLTILPSPSVKVCKLEIVHIGANMPCVEPPGPSITGYENIVIEYGTDPTLAHAFGEPAKLILKGLTNWGRSNMIPDLTPDADSLQIRNVTTLPKLEVKSLVGSNSSIWKHVSKVMHVDVFIPDHFYADLWLDVIHENMAENRIVDFCSIALIETGENLPCVRKNDDYNVTYLEDPQYIKIYHNEEETVHGGVQIKIPAVCYLAYSDKPDASKLTFLLAIRVRDDVMDGEVLNLKLVAKSEDTDEATHAIQMIALTVGTPNEGDISTSNIAVDEVKVEPDPLIGPEMTVFPGKSFWVPFHIYLPPEKILAMEASVLLPSFDGKAIFHAVDIKFGNSTGKNILCTGSNSLEMDLRRGYETTFDQSQNVTTFMQKDSITTNLGFVQNAGLTIWQEVHNETDDKFVIEVEVQLADHILAITDAIFTVTFAVKFGSVIVIAEQTMKVDRSSSPQFGRLIIDGQLLQSNSTFDTMDIIHVESLIYHDMDSSIEGYPTKIRVITPKHIALMEDNIVKANYSLNHSSDDALMIPDYYSNDTLLGGFDIVFPQGISFPDIISLNLTLTVDPENIRKPGSEEEVATIVLSPICFNVLDNSTVQCGSFISFEITIAGAAWSPPVRSGHGWNPYLEFDFLGVARVNRLSFQVPAGSAYRQITKVTVQASNVPGFFIDVVEVAPGPEINFAEPIVARYFRILISDLDSLLWDVKPIGINSVQWYGCMPKEFEANASLCQSTAIAVSEERTHHRHFAFDEPQNIAYVCDLNPQLDMICYSSDRNDGSNVWTELPRYISYIEGYSTTTGRMYFRETESNAVLSSANGKLIQLNDELPHDLEPARMVSGKSLPDFVDVLWPTGIPKGTYHGIHLQGDQMALQWSSCCS